MPDIKQALKDFVATSNSGKYKTEEELMSKFPELKGYDTQALRDYVATSNSGKYETEIELNSKFPELFSSVKKKDLSQGSASDSGVSTSTVQSESENKVTPPIIENPTTITDNGSGVDYSSIYGGDKAVTQVNLPQGITDEEITKRIEFEQLKQQQISEDISGQGVVNTDELSSVTPPTPVVKPTVTPKAQQFTPNPNLGKPIKFGGDVGVKNTTGKTIPLDKSINKAMSVLEYNEKIKQQQESNGKKLPEPTFETSTAVKDFNLTQGQWEVAQKAYNIYNKTIGKKGGKQYANFDEFANEYHKQKTREAEDFKTLKNTHPVPIPGNPYANMPKGNRLGKDKIKDIAIDVERQYDDITDRYVPQFDLGLNNIQEIASKANSGNPEAIQQLAIYNKYLKDVENVKNYAIKNKIPESNTIPVINGIKRKYTTEMFPAVNADWNNVLIKKRAERGTFNRGQYYLQPLNDIFFQTTIEKIINAEAINNLTKKQKSLMPPLEETIGSPDALIKEMREDELNFEVGVVDGAIRAVTGIVLDPMTYATGGVGKGVVLGIENIAKNTILKTGLLKGLLPETAKILSTKLFNATTIKMIPKAIEASAISGASFGLYEMANNAKQQIVATSLNPNIDFSYSSMFGAGAHGLGLGTAVGLLSPTMMAYKFSLTNKMIKQSEDMFKSVLENKVSIKYAENWINKNNRIITAKTTGLGLGMGVFEAQVFTGFNPKDGWAKTFAQNLTMIGILRGKESITHGKFGGETFKKLFKPEIKLTPEAIKATELDIYDMKNLSDYVHISSSEDIFNTLKNNPEKMDAIIRDKNIPLDLKYKLIGRGTGLFPTNVQFRPEIPTVNGTDIEIKDANGNLLSKKSFDTEEQMVIAYNEMYHDVDATNTYNTYNDMPLPNKMEVYKKMQSIDENYTKERIETALGTDVKNRDALQKKMIESLKPLLKYEEQPIEKAEVPPVVDAKTSTIDEIQNNAEKIKVATLVNGESKPQVEKVIETMTKIEELKEPILKELNAKEKEVAKELEKETNPDKIMEISHELEVIGKEKMEKNNEIAKMTIPELEAKSKEAEAIKATEPIKATKPEVKTEPIKEANPYQSLADDIRKGKIGKDIAMGTIPFAKEVWNTAIETVAKTVELTGNLKVSIDKAIREVKKSEWFKSLSDKDKESKITEFKNSFGVHEEKAKSIKKQIAETTGLKNEKIIEVDEAKERTRQIKLEAKSASESIGNFEKMLDTRAKELRALGITPREVKKLLNIYKKHNPEKALEKFNELVDNKDYANDVKEVSELQDKVKEKNKKTKYSDDYKGFAEIFARQDALSMPKELLKEFKEVLSEMTKAGEPNIKNVREFSNKYADVLEKNMRERFNEIKFSNKENVDKSIKNIDENIATIAGDTTFKSVSKSVTSITGFINEARNFMAKNNYTFKNGNFYQNGEKVETDVAKAIAEKFKEYEGIKTEADLIDYISKKTNSEIKETIDNWADKNDYYFEDGQFYDKSDNIVVSPKAQSYSNAYKPLEAMNETQLNESYIKDKNELKNALIKEKTAIKEEVVANGKQITEAINKNEVPLNKETPSRIKSVLNPDIKVDMGKDGGVVNVLDELNVSELSKLREIQANVMLGNVSIDAYKMEDLLHGKEKFFELKRSFENEMNPFAKKRLEKIIEKLRVEDEKWRFNYFATKSTIRLDSLLGKNVKEGKSFSMFESDLASSFSKANIEKDKSLNYVYFGDRKVSEFKQYVVEQDRHDSVKAGVGMAHVQQHDTFKNTEEGRKALEKIIKDELRPEQEKEFNKYAKDSGLTFEEYIEIHNAKDKKSLPNYDKYEKLTTDLKNRKNESFYLLNHDVDMMSDTFNFFDYKDVKDDYYKGKKGLESDLEYKKKDLVAVKDIMVDMNRKSLEKNGKTLGEIDNIKDYTKLLNNKKLEEKIHRMVEEYKNLGDKAEVVGQRNGHKFNKIDHYYALYMKDVAPQSEFYDGNMTGRNDFENKLTSKKAKHTLSRETYTPKVKDYDAFRVFENYTKELFVDYYVSKESKAYFGALQEYAKSNPKLKGFLDALGKAKVEGIENEMNGLTEVSNLTKAVKNRVTARFLAGFTKMTGEWVANPFMNFMRTGKVKLTLGKNKDAWNDLMEETGSPLASQKTVFTKDGNLEKTVFDLRKNRVIAKSLKYGKQAVNTADFVSTKSSSLADAPAKTVLYSIEFERAFKRITGDKFSIEQYGKDATYRDANREAINTASKIATTQAEAVWLPSLQFQKANRMNIFGMGKATKLNSNLGAVANTVVSFPIHQWKNVQGWTYDAMYNTGAGRKNAIANIAGVIGSGYLYAIVTQNVRAGVKYGYNILTGEPTTYEEEKLAKLLDPVYHIQQLGMQFIQLPTAEKSLLFRPIASALGDIAKFASENADYSSTEQQKEWQGIADALNGFLGDVMFARPSGLLDKPEYGRVDNLKIINKASNTLSPYSGLVTDLAFSLLEITRLSNDTDEKSKLENKNIYLKAGQSILTIFNLLPFQKDVDVIIKQEIRNNKNKSWKIKKDNKEEKSNKNDRRSNRRESSNDSRGVSRRSANRR